MVLDNEFNRLSDTLCQNLLFSPRDSVENRALINLNGWLLHASKSIVSVCSTNVWLNKTKTHTPNNHIRNIPNSLNIQLHKNPSQEISSSQHLGLCIAHPLAPWWARRGHAETAGGMGLFTDCSRTITLGATGIKLWRMSLDDSYSPYLCKLCVIKWEIQKCKFLS